MLTGIAPRSVDSFLPDPGSGQQLGHRSRRNREAEPLTDRQGRGRHAHHRAVSIQHRPTGITRVDGCIDLKQRGQAPVATDRTGSCADDTGGHDQPQAERIAEYDNRLAGLWRRVRKGEPGALDGRGRLQQGEIDRRITVDDLRGMPLPVRSHHLESAPTSGAVRHSDQQAVVAQQEGSADGTLGTVDLHDRGTFERHQGCRIQLRRRCNADTT